MKKILEIVSILYAFFWGTVFSGCNGDSSKIKLNQSAYEKIAADCPGLINKNIIIYYFDGDCGFCIAKAVEIDNDEKNKQDIRLVLIAKTNNPSTLSVNLKENHLSACMLIEKDNFFDQYLKFNELIRVDKNLTISSY